MCADDARPGRWSRFFTRDAAETTAFFRQMRVANRASFRDIDPDGGFTADYAAAGQLRADRLLGDLTMELTADPDGYVLFGQLKHGSWTLRSRRLEVRVGPGDSVLHPSEAPFEVEAQNFDFVTASLPMHRIAALAASDSGIDPRRLRFHAMTPISPARARYFTATLTLLHRELAENNCGTANPLVAEHLTQTMAAAVLAAFPNTTMTDEPAPASGTVAPAVLRRAVDFIDANAHRPLNLGMVSAAAGCDARTLQRAFRRHYVTTPMAHVRQVRLRRVHDELRSADPTDGDTVGAIAVRWGFLRSDRFAAGYRDVYGVPPDRTLHE